MIFETGDGVCNGGGSLRVSSGDWGVWRAGGGGLSLKGKVVCECGGLRGVEPRGCGMRVICARRERGLGSLSSSSLIIVRRVICEIFVADWEGVPTGLESLAPSLSGRAIWRAEGRGLLKWTGDRYNLFLYMSIVVEGAGAAAACLSSASKTCGKTSLSTEEAQRKSRCS